MSAEEEERLSISPQKRSPGDGAEALMVLGSPKKRAKEEKMEGPSERKLDDLLLWKSHVSNIYLLSTSSNPTSYDYTRNSIVRGSLHSPPGTKFISQHEDFSTFVENALSPLGKDFGAPSPMLKGLSHEDSNHGDEGSHGSASVSMHGDGGDWSPGVGMGSHSNLAPSEFKINFDGPLSQSSSPLGSSGGGHPRMRHKKRYDHGGYDGASGADMSNSEPEHDVMYNNRQALADRLKDSGDSSSVAGIAETPSSSSRMNIPGYLGSSLAIDVVSPSPQQPPADVAASTVTGRGARERKATPKSRGILSYGRQAAGGDNAKAARLHTTSTPTAEFLDLGLGLDRGPMACNCKKSRCLKLYCECFHALKFCQNCKCYDCENRVGNEAVRDAVINAIRERDPSAFESKVKMDPNSNSKGHLSGCHCKRTACLKKYCECFTLAVPCTQRCKCVKCQNNQSLYEIKVSEVKYTAAMLVSAAASAIDASGGDEYLSQASAVSFPRDDTATSSDGGYDSRGAKTGRSSPDSDASKRGGSYGTGGYGRQGGGVIPSSPSGMSLLDLAGACTEQEKHEEAREGLLALSPHRRPPTAKIGSATIMPPLPSKLDLNGEV